LKLTNDALLLELGVTKNQENNTWTAITQVVSHFWLTIYPALVIAFLLAGQLLDFSSIRKAHELNL
jgi:hypothetical protein